MVWSSVLNKNKSTLAFTIIEMLVVISIFMVVAGIILFNYRDFNTNATTNNVAQEIALTIRKAQSYSLGLQAPGVLSTLPVSGYGVRIFANLPDRVMFFSELMVDNQYTTSFLNPTCGSPLLNGLTVEECLEYNIIGSNDRIDKIYIDGQELATLDSAGSVDIVFKKPSGEVVFCVHTFGSLCTSSSSSPVHYVMLVITSPTQFTKNVIIYNNGQIVVQ